MTNVNEKLLNEIKEQNQQILLLLQSLVASNNEVKENNKKVEDSEIVENKPKKISAEDVAASRAYSEFYKVYGGY